MVSTNKQRLINQSTPDINISKLKSSDQKLYQAIKNLGDSGQTLINSIFPRNFTTFFRETLIINFNPIVGNDILGFWYHVILPIDPDNNWTFNNINLTNCYTTAQIQGASSTLSIDIKVSQRGTASFKSLFQPGFNPTLPINTTSTHNVKFSINSLFQDDLLRVDILTTDIAVSGISLDLIGNYVITEN